MRIVALTATSTSAQVAQALPERLQLGRWRRAPAPVVSDPRDLCGLLRFNSERHGQRPKREPAEKGAPVHY